MKNYIFKLDDPDYELLENYVNSRTKILFKHKVCGSTFYMKPNDFQQGHRCPICSNKRRGDSSKRNLFIEKYSDIIKKQTNNEYLVLTEYKNSRTKVLYKHNTCNQIFYMKPNDFQQGHRCPICKNISKGENKIREFLESNNIGFESQKTFKGCLNKKLLRFDFYIPSINTVIEYDGKQHSIANSFNHTEEEFNIIVENDEIKNSFCRENNISIIRIDYINFKNIEDILFREILQNNQLCD